MSTRLIQVVSFANVASAGTVALPHNINVNGAAKKPDYVAMDAAGFTVTVTATQVSVTNNNDAPASVNVWLELKHTTPRELGALANLSPQPFVAATGGGGGGGGGTINVQHDETPVGAFATLDFNGPSAPTVTDAGGGVASLLFPAPTPTPVTTDSSLDGDGSTGDPLRSNPAGSQGAGTGPDPFRVTGILRPTEQLLVFTDFLNYDSVQWDVDDVNSHSSISLGTVDGTVGLWSLDPRNAFTSYASVILGAFAQPYSFSANGVPNGRQNAIPLHLDNCSSGWFDARVIADGVPTLNNDCTTTIGWSNQTNGLFGASGAYFLSSFANNGNGNWWARSEGPLSLATDTGIAVDPNQYHRFSITWDKATETFKFFYDGVLVATQAQPGWNANHFPGVVSVRNDVNGAESSRQVRADWMGCGLYIDRSAPV